MITGAQNALVSIITPVYNAAEFLEYTIKTVQDQTYDNWELILINDQSTDDSVDIIKKFMKDDSRIKLIILKENSGAAIARNAGTESAKGRYLAFLDADDLWVKNKLELQIAHMKRAKRPFSYTSYEFADANGVPNGTQVRVPLEINYTSALKNNIVSTCTVMLDLKFIDKKHVAMENLTYGEDATTWWRLLKVYGRASGLDEVLFYYRRTSDSLSANKFKAIVKKWKLYMSLEELSLFCRMYYCVHSLTNALRKRM